MILVGSRRQSPREPKSTPACRPSTHSASAAIRRARCSQARKVMRVAAQQLTAADAARLRPGAEAPGPNSTGAAARRPQFGSFENRRQPARRAAIAARALAAQLSEMTLGGLNSIVRQRDVAYEPRHAKWAVLGTHFGHLERSLKVSESTRPGGSRPKNTVPGIGVARCLRRAG